MPLDSLVTTEINTNVYLRAADLLREHGWQQCSNYSESGPVCILQAVQMATGAPKTKFLDYAGELVPHAQRLGFEDTTHAWRWNDNLDRTKEEVIARLEAAAQP